MEVGESALTSNAMLINAGCCERLGLAGVSK
jgi:hypothetical protein